MERSAVASRSDLVVRRARLLECERVGEGHDTVEKWIVPVESLEVHLRQLDRRDLSGSHELREMRQRPESDVFELGGTADGRRVAHPERPDFAVETCPWHDRAEVHRWSDGVVDLDRAQRLVALEVAVQSLHHFFALLVGERETGYR